MAPRNEKRKKSLTSPHRIPRVTNVVRVTHVSFRCNIELKPYQHAHIEMGADVPKGMTEFEVLAQLKTKVGDELRKLKNIPKVEAAKAKIAALRRQIAREEELLSQDSYSLYGNR